MAGPAKESNGGNRLQWWIMACMWAVILAGGFGWGNHVNARIDRLENANIKQTLEITGTIRDMISDHEKRPHAGAVSHRELGMLSTRLDRIEAKIDRLAK